MKLYCTCTIIFKAKSYSIALINVHEIAYSVHDVIMLASMTSHVSLAHTDHVRDTKSSWVKDQVEHFEGGPTSRPVAASSSKSPPRTGSPEPMDTTTAAEQK